MRWYLTSQRKEKKLDTMGWHCTLKTSHYKSQSSVVELWPGKPMALGLTPQPCHKTRKGKPQKTNSLNKCIFLITTEGSRVSTRSTGSASGDSWGQGLLTSIPSSLPLLSLDGNFQLSSHQILLSTLLTGLWPWPEELRHAALLKLSASYADGLD